MKDFSSAVNSALQAMIDNGKFEAIIQEKLEKTVESAISEALKSYSDFGKALGEHIKNSLQVNLENVNLQEYGHTVVKMVEGLVNQHVQESARGKLLEQLNELFETPPQQITLQQLFDAYKADEEDQAHCDGTEYCGLVVEKSDHGFVYVGFNPSDRKDNYKSYSSAFQERVTKVNECEIQLHFSKGKNGDGYEIRWISFGGHKAETTKYFMPTLLNNTSRRLFQMYCSGTLVMIDSLDADDYERSYSWVD